MSGSDSDDEIMSVARNAMLRGSVNKLLDPTQDMVKRSIADKDKRFVEFKEACENSPILKDCGVTVDLALKKFQGSCGNGHQEAMHCKHHVERLKSRFPANADEIKPVTFSYQLPSREVMKAKTQEVFERGQELIKQHAHPFEANQVSSGWATSSSVLLPRDLLQIVLGYLSDPLFCLSKLVCHNWSNVADSCWQLKAKARWDLTEQHVPADWRQFYIEAHYLAKLDRFGSTWYDDQHLCVQDQIYFLGEWKMNGGGGPLVLNSNVSLTRKRQFNHVPLTKKQKEELKTANPGKFSPDELVFPGESVFEEPEADEEDNFSLKTLKPPSTAFTRATTGFIGDCTFQSHTTRTTFQCYGFLSIGQWSSKGRPLSLEIDVQKWLAIDGGSFGGTKIMGSHEGGKEPLKLCGLLEFPRVTHGQLVESRERDEEYEKANQEMVNQRIANGEAKGIPKPMLDALLEDIRSDPGEKKEIAATGAEESMMVLYGFGQSPLLMVGLRNVYWHRGVFHKMYLADDPYLSW
eukprot:TRINITY_DN62360_c0_g1_i3.p1 TRINITY_DN62360_c0_g1~~TRINITY_DN62360_c0_g1_i3.p1  ORF type:complete len:520 (-),score=58.02 TRINITY_DN62360_c0_g1_i3:438-1997(-)